MWCPRCNQGKVVKAQIIENNNIIFICEECDASWINKKEFENNEFKDFSLYMESIGLKGLWSEVKIMNHDE